MSNRLGFTPCYLAEGMFPGGFPSELVNLAIKLMTCVASAAGLECQLSTLRSSYGQLRQRPGVAKRIKEYFLFSFGEFSSAGKVGFSFLHAVKK